MSKQSALTPKQLRGLFRILGVVFFTAGGFLLLQADDPHFIITDAENDFMLGVSLAFVGAMDIILSFVMFKDKDTK